MTAEAVPIYVLIRFPDPETNPTMEDKREEAPETTEESPQETKPEILPATPKSKPTKPTHQPGPSDNDWAGQF